MFASAARRAPRRSLLTMVSAGISLLPATSTGFGGGSTGIARCEGNQGDKNDWQHLLEKARGDLTGQGKLMDELGKTLGSQVQGAIDSGIPTQLSYGFISGYCAGLAAKKAGKLAASIFGLGFMTLQTLAYNGYIEVNHAKIQESVEHLLDLNSDGKIDGADADEAYGRLLKVLEFNLPAGSGFAAGFMGGVRSG